MNRMLRNVSLVFVLAVVLLAGCAQPAAPASPTAEKQAGTTSAKPAEKAESKPATSKDLSSTVSIGSGTTGGGQYAVATGIAKVVADHTPIKMAVRPFSGPAAWMPMIETGELGLGVMSGTDAGWAYNGVNGYDSPNKSLRIVMNGNLLPVAALVVRNDSDIKSIKDLRGKRVASEYGGNVSMREIVTVALESAGLTWNDVKAVPVPDVASALRALQEGRADAACGGTPTHATAMEVDAAIGLRLLNFGDLPPEQANNPPKELVEILKKRQPGASIYLQKKQGFLKSDATAFHYPVILVATSKLSADTVYEITKTLYEYDKELQPVHAWTKDWKQETMFDPLPNVPYHEGAVRFWKEKGLWTAEAEANQKKLLGQ